MGAPFPHRRFWPVVTLCTVLATLFVVRVWVWAAANRPHESGPPAETAAFTLEELCKDLFDSGWRVKHPPDLPGPYRRSLPGQLYYHPKRGSSTVRLCEPTGAVVWEEHTRPGVEFLTLELETTDGRRAHGLLVRLQ